MIQKGDLKGVSFRLVFLQKDNVCFIENNPPVQWSFLNNDHDIYLPFKLDILDANHADVPHAQFDLDLCNLNFDHNTNYLELAYMTW